MKRTLLTILGIGIGWILGISLVMIIMPISGISAFRMTFTEAVAGMVFFAFPGFILLMFSIILALHEDPNKNIYTGKF